MDIPSTVIGDRWLSVDEAAAYLGVRRDTIYKWIVRKKMPARKVGRLWKFRKQEIDQWVCSQSCPPKPLQSDDRIVDEHARKSDPESGERK